MFFLTSPVAAPDQSPSAIVWGAAVSPNAQPHADVILTADDNQLPVIVRVGQIINVQPGTDALWRVDYRREVLTALTQPGEKSQPDASGWFFRAIAPGSTEIRFESAASPCPGGTPCPPTILQFVFPIQVIS